MFGHPRGLSTLFFTEMWERFSYYGMRALLVLYLTSQISSGGFAFTRDNALEIYGIFTALVYLSPLLGGFLADKVLGQRKAIYIGGFIMLLGQCALAFSQTGTLEMRTFSLLLGLGLLVVGNGFFKPNISTIVGKLYADADPKKDSAFTLFYMGINIGGFFSPIVAGTLGKAFGWGWGFLAAALGMAVGMAWFFARGRSLHGAGLPPGRVYDENKRWQFNHRDRLEIVAYVIGSVILVAGVIELWHVIGDLTKTISFWTLAIVGASALLLIIVRNTNGTAEWNKVAVILILCFFNIFFFAGFEQAGGTMNLFAETNTARQTFLGIIPASLFQSINPVFIVLLAPVFSIFWSWMASRGKEPNTPVKFGLGLLFLGVGFWVMSMAASASSDGNLVSPLWLVMVYLFHTVGELCLSPIGLAMISKLSPQRIVSVMMGIWFASTALAQYISGVLEALLRNHLPAMPLFTFLTLTSVAAGIVLVILSPFLYKMMK